MATAVGVRLTDFCCRAGVKNAKILLTPGDLAPLRGELDWVLVDAPCTGSGTLRRQPEARYDFSLAVHSQTTCSFLSLSHPA